jgi:hypothetical protein
MIRWSDLDEERVGEWLFALKVFVTARVLATAAALVGATGVPLQKIATPSPLYVFAHYSVWADRLIGVWERSDAVWYIFLARFGYGVNPDGVVFMPVYVLLIRLMHIIPMLYLEAALIISNVAALVALYLNYRLCASELGDEVGKRATWFLALFPGSFFFLAPYTESLFLALALGTWWLARQRRWGWAVLAAAVLGVTRNSGVLILVPLALEVWRQRHEEPPGPWWPLAVLPLGLCGIASYAGYWYYRSGDALMFVHHQTTWDRHPMSPFTTLALGLHQAWQYLGATSGAVYWMEALALLFVLLMWLLSIGRLPLSYVVWTIIMIVPPLCAPFPGRVLMSSLRFDAVLFPVFWTLAVMVKNRDVEQGLLLLFAGLYALSVALYVSNQWMF